MDKFFKTGKSKYLRFFAFFVSLLMLTFICAAPETVFATETDSPGRGLDINASIGDLDINASTDDSADGLSSTLQILILLTVISLAPSILIMVTSFTRILVVLHFARTATGLQTTPPNQVLIGLALFLTLFIMSPVFTQINEQAVKPLTANEITQEEALERGLEPLRDFMFKQIRNESDLTLFCNIAGIEEVETLDDDYAAGLLYTEMGDIYREYYDFPKAFDCYIYRVCSRLDIPGNKKDFERFVKTY
jgi:flagellar biosynthetic protein FliP